MDRPSWMSWTYRGPSGYSQGINTKVYDLMIKLYLRSNSPCITYLFLFFTGRTSTQNIQMGTSMGRLRHPVLGPLGDQMMGSSKDVQGTLVKHFLKNSTNLSNLLSQVTQNFTVNGSNESFSVQYNGYKINLNRNKA